MADGNLSQIKDFILFVTALYGAVLSTFNFLHARKKEVRSVKVSASTVRQTFTNGQLGEPHMQVEVVNIGQRPVAVTTITLERPSGSRIYKMVPHNVVGLDDSPLPAKLSDGEKAHWVISYADVGRALASVGSNEEKVTPICVLSTGEVFRGKPWVVDPREFIRMAAS